MRFSRAGQILSGAYLALAALLWAVSLSPEDDKAIVVLRQLSVWPGLILLAGMTALIGHGLDEALQRSWVNSFPALLLLNTALLYGLGRAAGRLRAWARVS